MASNERSLGWATSTTNDGAAAYASSRMIAMEQKTIGNGILFTGSNLEVTYAGSTLTIADGAAMINGYFYESTSASTIPTSTLNGTYTLALIANASGSSYTVSRSTADTTTVLNNTVRMALATGNASTGQLGTIGAANYIAIASVTVGATGLISAVVPLYPQAVARNKPNTQYAFLKGGTATLTNASTWYDLTAYASYADSTDGTMSAYTSPGYIAIRSSGVYTFSIKAHFDTNQTGTRLLNIRNLDEQFTMLSAAQLPSGGVSVYQASVTSAITVTPGNVQLFYLEGWASNAGRSITDSTFMVARV